MIFILIVLAWLAYYDARTLQALDATVYARTIKISPVRWGIYMLLVCFAVLPVYLVRRARFDNALGRSSGEEAEETRMLLPDACGVVLTWACGILIIAVGLELVALVCPSVDDSLGAVVLTAALGSVLMLVLIRQVSRRYTHGSWAGLVGLNRPRPSVFRSIMTGITIGAIFAAAAAWLISGRAVSPTTPLNEIVDANESSAAMALFLMMALLIAPFLEELIFRGYFYGVLARTKGRGLAVAAVSIMFAVLHVRQYWGDWSAIAVVGLLGLALTLLRAWSGSAIPGIAAHYAYNGLIMVLQVAILFISNPPYSEFVTRYQELPHEARVQLLTESIRTHPNYVEAYNDLAWEYAESEKNLPEALRLVGVALQYDPSKAQYLDTKARILFAMGRRQEAVAIERGLVQKHPADRFYRQELQEFEGKTVTPSGPEGR